MRVGKLAAAILVLGLSAAASLSPEAEWKKGIAEENFDFAKKPHAMLKIQSAAYIGEGQVAVLNGVPGKPESWQWDHDGKRQGFVRAEIRGGKLFLTKAGRPIDEETVKKSVPIDKDVDLAGQPTQV